MKKHTLNVEMSREVYEYYKDGIKPKACYNNIFNIFSISVKTFRDGKWKVCYGYAETLAGLYCRHCFIIDENDKVIDPTLYAQDNPPLDRGYYAMYVFDDVDEYLTAIEDNDLMPALNKYLFAYDVKAKQWAKNNGEIFI